MRQLLLCLQVTQKSVQVWFLYIFWKLNKYGFQIPWRMCSEFVKACNAGGSVNREILEQGGEKRSIGLG